MLRKAFAGIQVVILLFNIILTYLPSPAYAQTSTSDSGSNSPSSGSAQADSQLLADPIIKPLKTYHDPNHDPDLYSDYYYPISSDTAPDQAPHVAAQHDENYDPNLINDGDTGYVDVYFLLDQIPTSSSGNSLYLCFKDDPNKCSSDPQANLWQIFSGNTDNNNNGVTASNRTANAIGIDILNTRDHHAPDADAYYRFEKVMGENKDQVLESNIVHIRVCGSGHDWVDAFDSCQSTAPDKRWFKAGTTHHVTLWEGSSSKGTITKKDKTNPEIDEIGDASFFVHHYYPNVYLASIIKDNSGDNIASYSLVTPTVGTDPDTGKPVYLPGQDIGLFPDSFGDVHLKNDNYPVSLQVKLNGRREGRGDQANNYSVELKNASESLKVHVCTTVSKDNLGVKTFDKIVNKPLVEFKNIPTGKYTIEVKEQVGESRAKWSVGVGTAITIGSGIVGGTVASFIPIPGISTTIGAGIGIAAGGAIATSIVGNSPICDQGFSFWRIHFQVEKVKNDTGTGFHYETVITNVEKDPDGVDFANQELGQFAATAAPGCTKDGYDKNSNTCNEVYIGPWKFSTDPSQFVSQLLSFILGLAGIIAIMLMLWAGYELMMSQGDKQKLQAARDRITALIIGLVFIILSLVILQFIGTNILNIPGFK